ncbi:MAG: helix-turn-helix domain-containing protein [Dysgonomonas sp.]
MDIFDPVIFYYILTFAISFTIIILGIMLLGLHIAPDKTLDNLRFTRNYLAISYFVLAISGFVSFFFQEEAENQPLMASCTLIIASYQALLFTYTILALIQPLYIKRKQILIQLGVITVIGILLLITVFFAPLFLHTLFFYIIVGMYFLQISYYTYIFRLKYNTCLQSLEEYYGDDERIRLQWVNLSFYSALTIGILALTTLFLNIYFLIFFSILYTVYYAYMVSRIHNYQIDFKFAIPVVTQDYRVNGNTGNSESQLDLNAQTEKCEQFKYILSQWVEDKKFTEKDISVDEIAESLNVNRSFFQYYFRTHIQTDFRTWRSELRIREAQSILTESPEISLEKVRELVGFNHRANFHHQFQKITGVTPTEFKLQSRRNN